MSLSLNAKVPSCVHSVILNQSITFHRLLSDKDSEGHAHVFEAAIESTAYAVKLVRALGGTRSWGQLLKLDVCHSLNSMILRKTEQV